MSRSQPGMVFQGTVNSTFDIFRSWRVGRRAQARGPKNGCSGPGAVAVSVNPRSGWHLIVRRGSPRAELKQSFRSRKLQARLCRATPRSRAPRRKARGAGGSGLQYLLHETLLSPAPRALGYAQDLSEGLTPRIPLA